MWGSHLINSIDRRYSNEVHRMERYYNYLQLYVNNRMVLIDLNDFCPRLVYELGDLQDYTDPEDFPMTCFNPRHGEK